MCSKLLNWESGNLLPMKWPFNNLQGTSSPVPLWKRWEHPPGADPLDETGSIGLIMVSTFCQFPCQFPMVKSWWNHVKSNIWCFCYFLMSLFFCFWTYLSHPCQTIKPLKNYHQLSVGNMSGNGAVYDSASISSYNFDVWLWNFMRIWPLQEVTTLKTCHETQSRLVTLG